MYVQVRNRFLGEGVVLTVESFKNCRRYATRCHILFP